MSYQEDRYDAYDKLNKGDTEPPWSAMTLLSTDVLLKAANGSIDLAIVARTLLASRGIGVTGIWEGFKQANEYWRSAPHPVYAAIARGAGSTPSEIRKKTARENGKKGGRPRKNVPAPGRKD